MLEVAFNSHYQYIYLAQGIKLTQHNFCEGVIKNGKNEDSPDSFKRH